MRWQRGGIAVSVALALLVSVVALVLETRHAAPTPFASPSAPDALTQPLLDGCQRNPLGLLSDNSPEWVYVYDSQYRGKSAPPAQWVSGVASSHNPRYQAVHVSGGDLPTGHDDYDFNLNILPDPQYMFLLGGSASSKTGNYAGSGEESFRLHTEWEDTVVPQFAWPEPGDRITELGSWVWDCGHWGTPSTYQSPDYVLPKVGQPCLGQPDPAQCAPTGESTEFHPYRVLWVDRAHSPVSATGEHQADLFVSTAATKAGLEANCAHQFPAPAPAQGQSVDYGPDYHACLLTAPQWQDVSGDYSFVLSAPKRPQGAGELEFWALDKGSWGAPAPTLTREGDNAVRVSFHLDTKPGQQLNMSYSFFIGWSRSASGGVPTRVHVNFDRLDIHRAMDPGCSVNAFGVPTPGCPFSDETTNPNQLSKPPGTWNLYFDAGGVWGRVNGAEFDPNDGDSYSNVGSVDFYVQPGSGWRLLVLGRECDLGALGKMGDCPNNHDLATDNDVPGLILDVYPSADSSVGTHTSDGATRKNDPTSTCPDSNPHGCYTLTYTVTELPTGS